MKMISKIFLKFLKMSYLDKCVSKTDLLFRQFKPSSNLIVFIYSENVYIIHTLKEMNEIVKNKKNHYIEDSNKIASIFYLPNGIRIDSSLETCFKLKLNTFRLVKTSQYRIGYDNNKQKFDCYSAIPVDRKTIGSVEESSFFNEEKEDVESDASVEIDWSAVEKFKNNEKKKFGTYVSIEEKNEFKCVKVYKRFKLVKESWFKNNKLSRDGDLPAVVEYSVFNSEKPTAEMWFVDGKRYRENDKPVVIKYHQNGNIKLQLWFMTNKRYKISYHYKNENIKLELWCDANENINSEKLLLKQIKYFKTAKIDVNSILSRGDDLPAGIEYFENGIVKSQAWYLNGKYHREGNLPAKIYYYKNEVVKSQEWFLNGKYHREGDLPSEIVYFENGVVKSQIWYLNEKCHREGDLPAEIEYFENGVVKSQIWYLNGKCHREGDLPSEIYYENGKKYVEKWCQNNEFYRDGNKPTQIKYYENGNKNYDAYNLNNNLISYINADIPGFIFYRNDEKNTIEKKIWIKGDNPYRENDLPNFIEFYETGEVFGEGWIKKRIRNGCVILNKYDKHRDNDLPAVINYNKDGSKIIEKWYNNGVEIKEQLYNS